MSSAMKFEEYLRQQAERGQFGVALIESEIALGIADWIELHRDAVPVVRCRDCKYIGLPLSPTAYNACKHKRAMVYAPADGFCCWGERGTDVD